MIVTGANHLLGVLLSACMLNIRGKSYISTKLSRQHLDLHADSVLCVLYCALDLRQRAQRPKIKL